MVKRILWFAVIGLLAFTGGSLGVRWSSQFAVFPDADLYRQVEQFRDVLEIVQRSYLEPEDASYEKLTSAALRGMLGGLDPHSDFLPAAEFEAMQSDTRQEYGGIGVQVESRGGKLVVVAPIRGTPGERAGFMRGDQLVRVEGRSVEGLAMEDLVERLRGEPGTAVLVTVHRPSSGDYLDLRVVREVIEVESVTARMLPGGIGYVEIANFYEKTGDEFRAALDRLEAEGMRALVIDLRNNPGGLLTAAVEVAGQFFAQGELVVYTQGRDGGSRQNLVNRRRPRDRQVPVAVLVNSGSASASEIVAGALQDTRRAVVVGETTFGKGLVQSVLRLRSGDGIRLTTAQYFTPRGRVIHEYGVKPDIEIVIPVQEEIDLRLTRAREGLMTDEEFRAAYGFAPVADRQLNAAVDALRGVLFVEGATEG